MDREDIKELGEVDENGIYMLNIIGEIERNWQKSLCFRDISSYSQS